MSPDEPPGSLVREPERSDRLWDRHPDDGGFPRWVCPEEVVPRFE